MTFSIGVPLFDIDSGDSGSGALWFSPDPRSPIMVGRAYAGNSARQSLAKLAKVKMVLLGGNAIDHRAPSRPFAASSPTARASWASFCSNVRIGPLRAALTAYRRIVLA
jgi:hypothetical protein